MLNPTQADLSPAFYQSVLDYSLTRIYAAIAVRDPDTNELVDFQVILSNYAFRKAVARTEAELSTNSLRALFPVLDRSGYFNEYRRVVETGISFTGELDGAGPAGRDWYKITVRKLNDGIVVNLIDITDRKQQEQANLLKTIANETQSAIALLEAVRDEAGTFVDLRFALANPTCAQILGRSQQELIGANYLSLFPEAQHDGMLDLYRNVLETGEPLQLSELEYRSGAVNGWFDTRISRYGDGAIVTFNDITAIKENELALSRQSEQLRATLDASLSSIFYMTAIYEPQTAQIIDFRVEMANKATERSINMKPEEIEGHTLMTLFPGNAENGFFDAYVRVMQTGQPEQMTQHYRDELGLEGWFEVSAVKQGADSMVVTFMNVTESKQLERQLRESNASLDQFAAVASHDLQEPLRKINSFSQVLREQYASRLGDGAELLLRMQSAANRMQTLIHDLLAYSRLSGGQSVPNQSVDLNRLIGDVLIDLEVAIQEKVASIQVDKLPALTGNALQLRQIFQNLLSNALKFSKPNLPPHVRVSGQEVKRTALPAELILPGKPRLAYWQITVADAGIGFNEAYRERIFGAFERLHGRSSQYSGTGIGLAIVKKVMDNHGGAVLAHSREGEGATFTLYFPK
ncbi:PAS domain-containing protein [Fibrella sp. HMF5335]|uniref:histidine kinase n=1 Tax=Fibrella rubiginis TaxID=2817060 RepID=A0A939GGW9_9BACT|nr:PAS domain-containing protein [Fibrella rubiginis]MBO0936243.1 PAS domain-containing protein [Fibrella rubiginis]